MKLTPPCPQWWLCVCTFGIIGWKWPPTVSLFSNWSPYQETANILVLLDLCHCQIVIFTVNEKNVPFDWNTVQLLLPELDTDLYSSKRMGFIRPTTVNVFLSLWTWLTNQMSIWPVLVLETVWCIQSTRPTCRHAWIRKRRVVFHS